MEGKQTSMGAQHKTPEVKTTGAQQKTTGAQKRTSLLSRAVSTGALSSANAKFQLDPKFFTPDFDDASFSVNNTTLNTTFTKYDLSKDSEPIDLNPIVRINIPILLLSRY